MEPESEAGQTTFVSYDHVVELPAARGAQMSDYRVYFIGDDGHFVNAIQLDCPKDIAAIESAKQFINGHDIELWQQDRIIAKFERKPGGQWRKVSPLNPTPSIGTTKPLRLLSGLAWCQQGKRKNEALKAGMPRNAADIRELFFAKRGWPPK
jgi:hypothetical protein